MRWSSLISTSSPGTRAAAHFVLAVSLVGFGFSRPAVAEVRVSGNPAAVSVVTQGASLDDVLRALQINFKFHYRDAGTLPDAINGTYSGSLRSVVARLLAGHDYIMRGSQNDLVVEIFVPKGGQAPGHAAAGDRAPPPKPNAATPDSEKGCIYNDGGRMIPVEC